jgi:phage gp46-like protein
VAAPTLADAATAGATSVGGQAGAVDDLAAELARSLTAPLRERIERGFVASDGNLDDVADRVRALYREWKGQRLVDTSRHYAAAAFARGAFDALPDGTQVHWVLDPQGGPCPDCDDNVLGGTVVKGSDFPTGHPCAPAHPGCRCLVVAADG